MADITVTGSTYGDVSHIVVYYDVTTKNLYDSNGNMFGNNVFTTFLNNNFTLEIHYVQNVDSGYNPEEWEVWDGLDGATVESSLSFDSDFLHAHKGTLLNSLVEGSTVASIDVPKISKDTINDSGTLVFNPFDPVNKKVVKYSVVEYITGSTYSYTLDGDDVTEPIAEASEVRVEDPLYLYVDSDSIYEANIQPQYNKGIFKFPVHVLSRKLLKALDYTEVSGVSGTMEHKIFVKQQSIIGISVSNETYTRNAQKDAVIQDVSYHAWTYTNDGVTTVRYTKSAIPVLNEIVYKKDSDGNVIYTNEIVSTSSSTAQQTSIKEVDSEISITYVRNNTLDVYEPYLYCCWEKDGVFYWTKGNDVIEGTSIYIVEEGSATLQPNTANPVLSTDSVLFRTFTFPFIVRNLVDYNVSINIPTKDINWGKEYVLSIIAEYIPGVVPFNETEFTVSDKVYINSVSVEKIAGLSEILDTKLGFISD